MKNRVTQDLIIQIYDVIADPASLETCLDIIAETTNAMGSIIFDWDRSDDYFNPDLIALAHTSNYPRERVKTYLEICGALEMEDQEKVRVLTGNKDNIELIDDSIFSNDAGELRKLAHVKALQKIGVHHRGAGVLNKDNPWISLFTIQLPTGQPPLTRDQRDFIEPLLPHMAKSLSLLQPAEQLRRTNLSLISAMDQLTVGVCLLDDTGRVVIKNQEFDRQLSTYKSMSIKYTGALRFTNMDAERRFNELKSHTLTHGKFGARPRKESISFGTDSVLCIEITPLHRCDEIGTKPISGFVVFSSDTSMPVNCNTEAIKHAFGLTDAEEQITSMIADGLTNSEIANRRGRSTETIKTQVKSIMMKTDCNTRTQFVRMIMNFGTNFLHKS